MLENLEGLALSVSPFLSVFLAIFLFIGISFIHSAERHGLSRNRYYLPVSALILFFWPIILALVLIKLLVKGRPPRRPPRN
jgi:hypothetical protein